MILALPGVYLLGWRLTDWLAGEPRFRHVLAPTAALGTYVLAVGIVGRVASSFVGGLWIGTVSLALLGVTWSVLRKIRAASQQSTVPDSEDTNTDVAHRSAESAVFNRRRRATALMLVSGLAVTLPVAFLTLKGDFFDDFNLIGHRSLIAQFQNDSFPPRHQIFPDYPFRYHYGFNLVAAALTGLFRISIPTAIDIVVIVGFFWSWCLAWRLGERLTRSHTGWWTPLGGLLGGGAFFWLVWYSDWVQHGAVGVVIGGNRINFPAIMYFFQKPFALGFPLALAVMLTLSFEASPRNGWSRASLLALLLAPLSLAQVVLFVTIAPCVVAQDLATERRLRAFFPLVLAIGLAAALGGVLFTAMPDEHVGLVRTRFWPAQYAPMDVLAWYFLTTGLLIPLGLLGLWVMPRLRVFFLLLIVGSFTVPLFFENQRSWDIVKFSTVGQFAAGLACGSALAWLAEKRNWLRRSTLVTLSCLLLASPIGYLGYWIRELVRPTPEIGQKLAAQRERHTNEHWEMLIARLREMTPLEGTIYCANPLLLRELLFAGLNTAGPARFEDPQFGIPPRLLERRRAHLEELPSDPERWRAEGIFWFVTGPGDPFETTLRSWVAAGVAHRDMTAGPWTLYRLVPREAGRQD